MPDQPVLADIVINISDFEKDPVASIREAGDNPVCVTNSNEPAFYCLSPEAFEQLLDKLDDIELAELARSRQGEPTVEINLDEL